ncbi:succinate dehydrogenase iron-sulfur subunit [Vulcanisaeta souniana]|uniref:succinate dehydrogenase iron-sulfur subunit n=1 Tax=Vulcanisaeta souniana TaxID=164452 RepID=UPI00166D56C5|nr:succinate dehydrogenase iron-sulfur subunit [Vulcanisaeta souniana]
MSSQQAGSALQTTVSTEKITITKPPLGSPVRRTYTFRVKRYDPEKGRYYWREYRVELTNHETVLDGLLKIKWNQDLTLSFRYSCRMGICGSCGMLINGTPRLACETKPYDLGTEVITVEPLSNFEPIKDLAADFSDFFEKHRAVKPWLIRKDEAEQFEKLETYYTQTEDQLSDYLEFAYCIKCGLCYSACPMVFLNKDYLGPQALAQAYRWSADNRDEGAVLRLKVVDSERGVWSCHYSGTCSKVCPKDVDPALAINLLKNWLLSGRRRR